MAGHAALDHGGSEEPPAKQVETLIPASRQTSQRARLLVLMAAIMVVGVVSQSALINRYLLRDFQRLEESQVRSSLRLIQLWLDRFLQPMEALARETVKWNEFTALGVGGDPEALRARLFAAQQIEVGYDVAAVIDSSGEVLFLQSFDGTHRVEGRVDEAELRVLQQHARELGKAPQEMLSGWTVVPGGLFSSAARKVPAGDTAITFIVGRHFDDSAMVALDDLSGTHVTTVAGTTEPVSTMEGPMEACTRLSPPLNVQPQMLCVRLQDSILERGRRSTDDLRLASLAGFVLLMFGAWWFLDRSLLRRLAGLTQKLDAIGSQGTEGLEQAMLADGQRGDELGRMSSGMGRLLSRVRLAELGLRERERSFRVLAESSGVAIFVVRDEVLYSNPFASRLSGYSTEELRGRKLGELLHEDSRERFDEALKRGSVDSIEGEELRGRRQDGTLYWARLHIARIEYQGSAALLVTLFDVSQQRHLEQVLADEKQNLQVILGSIHDGIVAVDHTGAVRFINPAAQRLTGIPVALAHGSALEDVVSLTDPDSGKPLRGPLIRTLSKPDSLSTLACVTTPQGRACSVEVSVSTRQAEGAEDDRQGSVLVMRDVSDLRQLTKVLAEQASHDDLTGLINRREFSRRLHEALSITRGTGGQNALCYVDLDQFKLLNDTCGHHAGDLMLREVAEALRTRVGANDTLARLGGDEFGVLLADCNADRAVRIANVLRSAVSGVRFQWNGQSFRVDASIGIAMLEHVEGGVDEALALADAACYMSKDLGRNRVHLYRTSDVELQQQMKHMRWATRLKEAVEQSQFILYAQPIEPVSAHAPQIHACEALVRMLQPDGRIVTPEEFVTAAERYQMMNHIDRWVVTAALDALQREHALGRDTKPLLFVNLSGQSLGDEGFRDFLLAKLHEHANIASQVVFEVTESAVIYSLARAKKLMEDVYERGSAFALDDFGTGMSSFGYLKEMRVDYLKIAGCFVKNIAEPLDAAVVRSFTEFARMMKVTVIAEWIEDETILQTLREMGVDYGQGWHLAPPAPIEQVLRIESGSSSRA